MKIPEKDAIFLVVNGWLQAENTALSMWTDAAGKRHVAGENLLLSATKPEVDFEHARAEGRPVNVRVVRGSTNDAVAFEGVVISTGMRCTVNEPLRVTFQIDEA